MSDRCLSYFLGDTSISSNEFYLKLVCELAAGVNTKLAADLDRFRKQYFLDDPTIPPELKQAVCPSEPRRIDCVFYVYNSLRLGNHHLGHERRFAEC